MSEFFRPTYGFEGGAYNATEVRLYGLPSAGSTPIEVGGKKYSLRISLEETAVEGRAAARKDPMPIYPAPVIRALLPIAAPDFAPNFIVLASGYFSFDGKPPPAELSSGVIFGYSFEGHCYDLPRPKLMLLPVQPGAIPADDCGYNNKPGYKVWIVDKLSKCIDLAVNQGFVEELVLEENMPGKRSPSTYRATMAMAHRSGRLTE